MKTKHNSGFSTIVAILLTAFLVVVSAGVLSIVLQESKNTRLVYNSISTYAGAEGAQEYALLKIKNHDEGFQDSIVDGQDDDSMLLAADPDDVKPKDQHIEYTMSTNSKNYSGMVPSGEFDIIPLFYDKGIMMQHNSKNPTLTGAIMKSSNFKLVGSGAFVWNIIGNDPTGETFGITGTGTTGVSIGGGYTVSSENGKIKKVEDDEGIAGAKKITFEQIKIKDFIDAYDHNYLILYNPTKNELSYTIESMEGFSTPKTSIIASSRIGNFKQNVLFEENKNRYFEALKYSIINK